jgi:hypothetical protein
MEASGQLHAAADLIPKKLIWCVLTYKIASLRGGEY